jgi:polysaccharide export outer membrane protein
MLAAAAFGLLAGTIPAAAQDQRPPAPAVSQAAPGRVEAAPAPRGLEYRLGAGDKIRINVFGEEALSGEFYVAGSGKVSLPLIGEVQAANLTVQAFQAEIETALRQGYLKEPRVSAEVLSYRPYYILGEVNKPGEYPYSNGLNVLNAVATAGGFTYRAQTKRVFIRRAADQSEQPYPLTSDIPVAPGDTIRISERFF